MQYDFEVPEFDEISSNAKVCDNTVRPQNSTLFDLKTLQKNQCGVSKNAEFFNDYKFINLGSKKCSKRKF